MKINKDPRVPHKFATYPEDIKKKLEYLRALIIEAADKIDSISELEETLKWDEPSYLTKKGSTVRIDWKSKKPDQYAMYFSCSTSLVETFKAVYGDLFKYEKKRAIIFDLNEEIPKKELKDCITMALQYHTLKSRPFLGR